MCVRAFDGLTVLKVELVEVHALYQVAQGLGFERGQSRVTDPPRREDGKGTEDQEGEKRGGQYFFLTITVCKLLIFQAHCYLETLKKESIPFEIVLYHYNKVNNYLNIYLRVI